MVSGAVMHVGSKGERDRGGTAACARVARCAGPGAACRGGRCGSGEGAGPSARDRGERKERGERKKKNGEKKMGKMEKKKKKKRREEKREKGRDASAPTAASGRA